MSSPRVTTIAVVLPVKGSLEGADTTLAALEQQTARPAETFVIDPRHAGSRGRGSEPGIVTVVEDAIRRAAELGDPWVWLLNSGVVPQPAALELLLAPLAEMDPRPGLLASRVLAPDGTLDRAAAPVPASHLRPDQVLGALDHRCLAIRVARSGSLLVHWPALSQARITSATALVDRDVEWTARLLGQSTGVLVPASVAVRGPDGRPLPPRSAYARIAGSVRMLSELRPEDDRVWFAVHLAERGLSSAVEGIRRYRGRSGGRP